MSYQPYQDNPLNPSGVTFFGSQNGIDQVYESSTNFVYDSGNDRLHVGNLTVNNNGYIGSEDYPQAISISNLGDVNFASGVVIQGNLRVNGTQTVVNTEITTLADNIILLNSGVSGANTNDAGIEIDRGTLDNVHLWWDEESDQWMISNTGNLYDGGSTDGYPIASHPIAGSGLSHDDSTDPARTYHVGQGNGITVGADDISVTDGSGIIVDSNGVHVGDGSGIFLTDDFVHVGAGNGIIVNDDDVAVNPGSGIVVNTNGVNVDIAGQTATTTPDDQDKILIHRTDDGNLYHIEYSNFVAGLGTTKSIEEITASKASSYAYKDVTLGNAGSSSLTATLPPAADYTGKVLTFKKIDSTGNTVSIAGSGSQTIDGGSSKSLYYNYESISIISNGTNWYII